MMIDRCQSLWLGLALLGLWGPALRAAEPPAATPAPAASDALALDQEQIAAKFHRFEEVMLRMAELTAATDPTRAALLRKAVAQSKDRMIDKQFDQLIAMLQSDRLATAVNGQQELEGDLAKLLELLLTEQRGDRLKDEQARIKEQIRKIKELINKEVELKHQTQTGGDPQGLAQSQRSLADETRELGSQMKAADDAKNGGEPKPGDAKNGEPKPGEAKPSESKPGEAKPPEGQQPSEGSPPAEGGPPSGPSPSQPGEPMPPPATPPSGGQPGEGQPGESGEPSPSQDNTPQGRVKAAEANMREAEKKLEEAKRHGAVEDQEAAIRELENARAALEEILRQLREEELERMLAQLEARFTKMLEMQMEVYEGTLRVSHVPESDRGRNDEIECGRLSRKESMIVIEAEKALAVLHAEGSAVAFPEAVDQMRMDMDQVVVRLAKTDVGSVTQAIEEDIIAALEEMIASLKKARQELSDQKGKPSPPGPPGDEPLVDQIAELKMIRSLQMRVNLRTKRFSSMIERDDGQGVENDLVEALRQLGDREQRIFRATRDIVAGKNE